MNTSTTLILWNDRGGRPVTPPFEPFPEAPVIDGPSLTHLVVQTETLRSICHTIYRDASLWLRLAEVNGIADPQAPLRKGTRLITPAYEHLLDWTG